MENRKHKNGKSLKTSEEVGMPKKEIIFDEMNVTFSPFIFVLEAK